MLEGLPRDMANGWIEAAKERLQLDQAIRWVGGYLIQADIDIVHAHGIHTM